MDLIVRFMKLKYLGEQNYDDLQTNDAISMEILTI